MSSFVLYLAFKIDELKLFAESLGFWAMWIGIFSGLVAIVMYIVFKVCNSDKTTDCRNKCYKDESPCTTCDQIYVQFKKICKSATIVAIVFFSFATLTPSTKQAIAIYAIPKIVNNEHVQAIPKRLMNIATDYLEVYSLSVKKEFTDMKKALK